jgi:DNA-binding transcriptional ArsR family regulator
MEVRMKLAKIDLLLHPIRMRLVQASIASSGMTVNDFGRRLADVPPATLYRHLNTLVEAGILTAVDERKVRGTVEKVYALQPAGLELTSAELAEAMPEDHMRFFTTFVAGLLGSFSRYLKGGDIDFVRDGVGYRQVTLQLSDAELMTMAGELSAVVMRSIANQPDPGRRARVFTSILIPEPSPQPDPIDREADASN